MGDSNTLTISTELGDVVVRKMALNDYAELLRALETLPKKFNDILGEGSDSLSKMGSSQFLSLLPGAIADSWGDFVALIAVPTDKDASWLGNLDGPDSIDVIVAIFELNDFPRIIASVKKLLGLRAKVAPAAPKAPAK